MADGTCTWAAHDPQSKASADAANSRATRSLLHQPCAVWRQLSARSCGTSAGRAQKPPTGSAAVLSNFPRPVRLIWPGSCHRWRTERPTWSRGQARKAREQPQRSHHVRSGEPPPSTSRIDLGSHHERVTTRPLGRTWPTARAGGPHTIQHAYQALMPPTRELRAACCISRAPYGGSRVQQQPCTSRIELGSHHERLTCRPHGRTWPTARAGGLHTIQHAYQALMTPTGALRAA